MNITMQQRIAKQVKTLKPIEGYAIVVFEIKGQSRICKDVITTDSRFSVSRLEQIIFLKRYEKIAISRLQTMTYSFEAVIEHVSQIHQFDLIYTLEYRIEDPASVCIHLDRDPLNLVVSEVDRAVGGSLASKPWKNIVHEFAKTAKGALEEQDDMGVTLFDSLNARAMELGIRIQGLKLHRRLHGDDLQVKSTHKYTAISKKTFELEHDAEVYKKSLVNQHTRDLEMEELKQQEKIRKHELELSEQLTLRELEMDRLQHEHEMNKRSMQLEITLKEDMVGTFKQAMEKLAENITSPEDLFQASNAVTRIVQGISSGPKVASLPESNDGPANTGLNEGQSRTAQAKRLIDESYCEPEAKKRFFRHIERLEQGALNSQDLEAIKKHLKNLLEEYRTAFDRDAYFQLDGIVNSI